MSQEEKKEVLLEAKILERLDHQNIIRFREVFIARKPRYTLNIVMDYADGGDLQSRVKEQKGKYFSETQILDWFTQICLSLKHIHDTKILHRDLKSQNVFLTKNGMVKLGDFGIAKCLDFTLQQVKTIVGTPYYLSPEIVMNKPYSFKSDIWSLGVILYELMALKLPFDATNLPLLSLKIIKGVFNPPPNTFSKDLRNLVTILLTVDSSKRPSINEILSNIYLPRNANCKIKNKEFSE
jgi:NIMA (never in mitosis gene a)-related kinase